MKYLILIYRNPRSREVWQSMSAETQADGLAEYQRIADELTDSGELIVTEALADPDPDGRIPAAAGRDFSTEGPFAEVKEYVGGFLLVDVASADRARAIAEMIPEAPLGLVEIRRVMSLAAFDL